MLCIIATLPRQPIRPLPVSLGYKPNVLEKLSDILWDVVVVFETAWALTSALCRPDVVQQNSKEALITPTILSALAAGLSLAIRRAIRWYLQIRILTVKTPHLGGNPVQRRNVSRFMTIFLVLSVLLSLASSVFAAPPAAPQPASTDSAPAAAPVSSGPETVDYAVQRMTSDAQGDVSLSYRNATGAVSFARAGKDGNLYPAGAGESAEAQAMGFLANYGAAFGISDAAAQLVSAGSTVDSTGATGLRYTQVHQGVPVFGSYLHVRVAADGALTAVNAVTVPGIKVSAIPALSPEKAGVIALGAAGGAERAAVSVDVQVQGIQLLVLREGLVRDVPAGADHLVYEVEVGNGSSVREFIYVDAHSGAIVDRIDAIQDGQEAPEALSRQISESSLANIKWTNPPDPDPIPGGWAGGTAQQIIDWNNEADGAKETYNIFGSTAGWDSYNNAGAQMRTVNNDPGISCPNANWNGTSTNYCTGVTADDVVAHEWGHAYTE